MNQDKSVVRVRTLVAAALLLGLTVASVQPLSDQVLQDSKSHSSAQVLSLPELAKELQELKLRWCIRPLMCSQHNADRADRNLSSSGHF